MKLCKPYALWEFYRSLHARGVNTASLAQDLGVSPAVVRRLIGMLRTRRGPTWTGLLEALTPRERELLHSVEQCSPWNSQQAARRPKWHPEKQREFSHEQSN